jgi:enoyl-CoA hydratase/carnithine racemase
LTDPREYESITVAVQGAVGELTLNRSEKLNALSGQMLEELGEAAAWFDSQSEVKAVLVKAAGSSFSAGADLSAMGTSEEEGGPEQIRQALDLGRRTTEAISGMRALTVAAIQGHCIGGGLVLALASDIRIAAEDARFAIPEVDLGIPLTWTGIPRLVRELGPSITKDLVLTCRPFGAEEALRLRLVSRVVPGPDLYAQARAVVEKLASQPSYSLQLTKRHVDAVAEQAGSTAEGSAEVDQLIGALGDEESQRAMAAYLRKRANRAS